MEILYGRGDLSASLVAVLDILSLPSLLSALGTQTVATRTAFTFNLQVALLPHLSTSNNICTPGDFCQKNDFSFQNYIQKIR